MIANKSPARPTFAGYTTLSAAAVATAASMALPPCMRIFTAHLHRHLRRAEAGTESQRQQSKTRESLPARVHLGILQGDADRANLSPVAVDDPPHEEGPRATGVPNRREQLLEKRRQPPVPCSRREKQLVGERDPRLLD